MRHKTLELQEDGLRIQRKSIGGWGNARTEEGLTDGIGVSNLDVVHQVLMIMCLDVVCDMHNLKTQNKKKPSSGYLH